MAVIKYQINGKADTAPFKKTEQAAQGMFQKIENIDRTLKAFVGVKVFSEVSKAINNSLKEYDEFKKSLKEELPLAKQMRSLNTTLSATLGTVRDELFNSLNNVIGGSFLDTLKEVIPRAGASLIAAMRVVEAIVNNVKNNFDEIKKPETWSQFFSNLGTMAISTIKFIGLALRDALCSAWDFFIYFIKGKDSGNDWYSVLHDVWATLFEKLGLSDWAEDEKMFAAARREKNQKYNSEHKPSFGFKPDTLAAMDDMGKSFSDALTVALNTLAGTDAGKLYDNAYSVALDKLLITIQTMEEAANKNEEELKKVLEELKKDRLAAAKENAGMAAKGFSDSGSLISKILGDADSGRIRKIRDTMNSLNVQFEASNNQIERLSEQLKSAKTATEIESIFDSINEQIERIGELTAGARGLEEGAARAKKAFDLLQGSLQAIGEAGQVIEMIMSSNVIGLIVVFLSKLAGVFSNLSGAAAAASNIITFLFDIITEIIQELTPFLDMLFRPLLEIVAAVGRIIGQLLNLLVPVLGLLTGVAQQFNLLTPILNTVAILLAIVTDCFGLLWNAVSWLIKNLTFGLVNMGRMQTDNYQKMVDSINAEQNYDSYKNNSTSYTVSGDLYIYIYYEHSYVNGDARAIALNLRDEIRAAEREGY